MFVGYEPSCKAYRIRVGDKLRISKNVKFVESRSGAKYLSQISVTSPAVLFDPITPEIMDEEEWESVPVSLPEVPVLQNQLEAGEENMLPPNLEVLQRAQEFLRGLGRDFVPDIP